MFKLRWGYVISGIITGCILLASFLGSLPDGKLHLVFCNVGQGDATYIRFPDGRDMLIDGGPNDSVLQCLGRHMPFWDRKINIIVNSHPQQDHLKGLISVLNRYRVEYVVRSDVAGSSDVYAQFIDAITTHHVPVRLVAAGEHISVGNTILSVLWPTQESVLGVTTDADLNEGSLVFWLRYGTFDALFPGDMTLRQDLAVRDIELLKVPHHGSKTGMTEDFIEWIKPEISVLSVGKNSYGHPSVETIRMLQSIGSAIHRTDKEGDIELVSDGKNWYVQQ